MAKKFIIDIFKPAEFELANLDLAKFDTVTGKHWLYASLGRNALYHILKSFEAKEGEGILIPAYICDTVLESVKRLGLESIFCDIDYEDLNISLESIKFFAEKYDIRYVLAASLYGNPANLTEIEKFCRERGIKLIDDAAQSFGAKLEGRFVGTFGDAGFFSFSPGKATAGHMGAFFWTNNENYAFQKTKHCTAHLIAFLDFYFNRLRIYIYKKFFVFRAISLTRRILDKYIDKTNDRICGFEKKILGGILHGILSGKWVFRRAYFQEFLRRFGNNNFFRIIESVRGESNNHKFVVVFSDAQVVQKFRAHLTQAKIYSFGGYMPPADDDNFLQNLKLVNGKVVEMPIEDNRQKMEYLFDVLDGFGRYID